MAAVTVEMASILRNSIEKWHMAGHFHDNRSFLRKKNPSNGILRVEMVLNRGLSGTKCHMSGHFHDNRSFLRKRILKMECFEWKWYKIEDNPGINGIWVLMMMI